MKEFANPFVLFEVAGVTMFLAFIALLICVGSWVYTDAKSTSNEQRMEYFSSYITILYWVLLYMAEEIKRRLKENVR